MLSLGTLLTNVNTWLTQTLAGRPALSCFFPLLTFFVLHGLMCFFLFEGFNRWVVDDLWATTTAAKTTYSVTALMLAIGMLSYAMSAILHYLQDLLEGKWWEWLRRLFIPSQKKCYSQLQQQLLRAAEIQADLQDPDYWFSQLADARANGAIASPGVARLAPAQADSLDAKLQQMRRLQENNELIDTARISQAHLELKTLLETNDADSSPTTTLKSLTEFWMLWNQQWSSLRRIPE
jgi:hypothetical protein